MSETISIPHEWMPRDHQLSLWRYMANGGRRGVAVWHRRAGKDSTALNLTCYLAHQRRGTYWHLLPEKEQARKAVWNGIDKLGRRIIDQVFPESIRRKTLDQEMLIELKCGSIWQVVGADNYNSLVGSNPVGVTLSEYSVGDPAAWNYLRPILAENDGWAMFLYTARGKNHGYELYNMAKVNPEWFAELLTVDDTSILSPAVIQAERESGMDEDMIQQEYYCSWEGVQQGSIYGRELTKARDDGRIGSFPYDRRYPVNTFWDLGHGDGTAIVFHQKVGGQDRFIDCYEATNQDMSHFVKELKDRGYLYGKHYFPHDAKNVTVASKGNPLGANAWDQAYALGLRDLVQVTRAPNKWTAITGTRMRMATAYFDEKKCHDLLDALTSYHKKWDEKRRTFATEPYHDWSSQYADAFRQWAQGYVEQGGSGLFTVPGGISALPSFVAPVYTIGSAMAGY